MTNVQAPDILRCAYMEIVVTDLEASRKFYVDTLGLVVTEEDDNAIYLRTYEEFIHHNLVLRKGPVPAVAAFSYRVRSPEDLDRAEEFYKARGCGFVATRTALSRVSATLCVCRIRWASHTSSSTR